MSLRRIADEIYDFITGGSIITPFGVALAILAAFFLPAFRAQAFLAIVIVTFIAATWEKPA